MRMSKIHRNRVSFPALRRSRLPDNSALPDFLPSPLIFYFISRYLPPLYFPKISQQRRKFRRMLVERLKFTAPCSVIEDREPCALRGKRTGDTAKRGRGLRA